MTFRILRVDGVVEGENAFACNPDTGMLWEFEEPQAAKAACKFLSQHHAGSKWRIKRIVDMAWRSRERNKFANGVYQFLPWATTGWWNDPAVKAIHELQFPHPSKKEPGMIAFTESPEQGMDNRRTRCKPGRYLERYFAAHMERHSVSIKRLATDFANRYEPRKLLFAETEDDIQWVYEHGPESCMSSLPYRVRHGWGYPVPGKWPLDMHACRVYAAGDLQVAYITDNDEPKGHVVGRSLVWPAKKTHSRCYGDEVRLKSSLRANGYSFKAPEGAKVQRHPVDGVFVLPYIDAGDRSGTGALAVWDKKTYLELTVPQPGSYAANSTQGISGRKYDRTMRPMEVVVDHCQRCESHVDVCGELERVWRSSIQTEAQMWCERCRDTNAYYCDVIDRYCANMHVPQIEMSDGTRWSEIAFRAHGFTCEGSHGRYHTSDAVHLADGTAWCSAYYEDHGFQCDYTGDRYRNSERIDLADGHVVCRQVLLNAGFTCSSCQRNFLNSQRRGTQCVSCVEIEAVGAIAAASPIHAEEHIP